MRTIDHFTFGRTRLPSPKCDQVPANCQSNSPTRLVSAHVAHTSWPSRARSLLPANPEAGVDPLRSLITGSFREAKKAFCPHSMRRIGRRACTSAVEILGPQQARNVNEPRTAGLDDPPAPTALHAPYRLFIASQTRRRGTARLQ